MTKPLFKHFLDDAGEYEASVQYWSRLAEAAADSVGQTGEWERWISPYYADGKTPIDRDLTPIFDARSRRLNRAFRIEQHRPPPLGGESSVNAWVETRGDEWDPDVPCSELFVSVVLSQETGAMVRDLLRLWMMPSTTVADMRTYIEEALSRLN